MPAERVSMRRIREILRLKHGGASDRQIARSLSLARSTVAVTLERAAVAGLRWPLPARLSDRVLEAMLYVCRPWQPARHAAQIRARLAASQRGATITPGEFTPVISVITITGIGDHLQPAWLITFTGIRK